MEPTWLLMCQEYCIEKHVCFFLFFFIEWSTIELSPQKNKVSDYDFFCSNINIIYAVDMECNQNAWFYSKSHYKLSSFVCILYNTLEQKHLFKMELCVFRLNKYAWIIANNVPLKKKKNKPLSCSCFPENRFFEFLFCFLWQKNRIRCSWWCHF